MKILSSYLHFPICVNNYYSKCYKALSRCFDMDFGRCPGIRGAALYADSGARIRAGAAACAESSKTPKKGNAALLFGGLPRRAAACNDKKNYMFNRFFEGQAPHGMTARKNESGRSLVEMLGVLAIMGILTIGGVAGYYFAMTRYRANEIIEGVKQRAMIVSSQEKQAPGMPQNLSEFEEKILDYKTTAWSGGLNGEENLFTIDVDDVPQAVCQDILIRNWDWPSGIFIYDEKMTDCPEGNVPMAFVFSADLNAQIKAREQNPCYGKGVCCEILNQETHTIRVGEYLVKRICQTAEANGLTCCANPTSEAGCIYDPDEIAKYKPFQETVITCKEDHICGGEDGLTCGCKESCGKDQTQDPATCQCTCTDSTKELWGGECLPKCDGTGMTGERDSDGNCICAEKYHEDKGLCCPYQQINVDGSCLCEKKDATCGTGCCNGIGEICRDQDKGICCAKELCGGECCASGANCINNKCENPCQEGQKLVDYYNRAGVKQQTCCPNNSDGADWDGQCCPEGEVGTFGFNHNWVYASRCCPKEGQEDKAMLGLIGMGETRTCAPPDTTMAASAKPGEAWGHSWYVPRGSKNVYTTGWACAPEDVRGGILHVSCGKGRIAIHNRPYGSGYTYCYGTWKNAKGEELCSDCFGKAGYTCYLPDCEKPRQHTAYCYCNPQKSKLEDAYAQASQYGGSWYAGYPSDICLTPK